jgi:hypothetical protein
MSVVISDILLCCACNSIVMLKQAHCVHHVEFCGENIVNLLIARVYIKGLQGIEPVCCVHKGLSLSDLPLGTSSGCEVARPIVFGEIGIGEHVIISSGPRDVSIE